MGYMKDAFENWARGTPRKNGTPYSKETIAGYVSSLRTHAGKLSDLNLGNPDLFFIDNIVDYDRLYADITSSVDYKSVNQAYHRIFSSALSLYRTFLQRLPLSEDSNMTQEFENWLRNYKDHKYSEGTIKRYIRALEKAEEWLGITLSRQVLSVDCLKEFQLVQQQIKETPDYASVNQSHGHGDLSAALAAYEKYLASKSIDDDWQPTILEYDPGISKAQWLELLNGEKTFTSNAYFAIACMYDCGGIASCSKLELKYGKTADFYRAALGVQVASKVREQFNLPYCTVNDKKSQVWPILFQGRKASDDEAGSFVWKIRPELYEALGEFGISRFLKSTEEAGKEEVIDINIKDALTEIKDYIFNRGFDYPDGLIENYYLSLKSKPFVILAGTSGTGKTRLVKLFAEAIGAPFKLVSVRPDWSDGSDLFGHTDLNGNFIPGPVCSAFETAMDNPNKPVFLCLDEMNLARVEYYLSDFLSVIESREKTDGQIITEAIAQYECGIPDNLYIIGTVNMDETTFPFSKKVLDRANTIEFNYVDLMPKQRCGAVAEPLNLPNNFLKTDYLVLSTDCPEKQEYVETICAELQKMNSRLVKANAHVGFRVRDEIVFYMLNNEKAGNLLTYEQALDNEIMQKILPRIQGSSGAIKTLLIDMFRFCMGNESGIDAESGSAGEQMMNAASSARYSESARKIGYMMMRYEDDGFTSYWL